MAEGTTDYIRWFRDLTVDDVPVVGGKNASLGEMYRELTPKGVRVPNGFAITADAYRDMLSQADAWDGLHGLLEGVDKNNVRDLARRGLAARELVYGAGLPPALGEQVLAAYRTLQEEYGAELSVAVRSSATAEDLPTASFAGQHETYLNVRGDEMLLDACRRCFASLFTDRGISYRIDQGFDHFKVALSVGVMKMVRSDLAASGVMFTLDTESGFRDVDLMCEIPNNVVQIDAFSRLFDGFSIGSNDLTQLVLGVDRDSEIVAFDFDERDPGVLEMIRLAIEGCRRNGRHSGICGQAPSDYPEVAEALVRMGIDSISLNPDTVLRTTRHVLAVERELGRAPRGMEAGTLQVDTSSGSDHGV